MFRNLEAEMAREGISKNDLAKCLGVRYGTVIDKTKGRSQFAISEAFRIKERFFPNCSLEYLFEKFDEETSSMEYSNNQNARDGTDTTNV
jgi:DNA-binding XRE family transcriptional regulator